MRTIILILPVILSIFLLGPESLSQPVVGPQCRLDIPDGWSADDIIEDEMSIRNNEYNSARLLIRRYELDKGNQIGSESGLRQAIHGLYRQLGIHQVTEDEIDFTIDGNRAEFGREYTNMGHNDTCLMHYNLKGILVRRGDLRQVFYLLQAEAPDRIFDKVSADITTMMKSLEITSKLSDDLFPKGVDYGYFLLMLVMAALVFFFVKNRKIQRSRNPLGRNSQHYWRCPTCQLVNHVDSQSCQRCGTERVLEKTQ